MPSIETPPNPVPAAPPPAGPERDPVPMVVAGRVQTRFGELDHTELVQLLDSLEGDNAKSRFRESVYISIIFYLALAWLVIYGPKYVFRTGRIVPSVKEQKEKDRLTQLALNNELAKVPKLKPAPKLDNKTMEQLHTMQRASDAAHAARQVAAPTPAPQQPAPQPVPAAPPPPVVAASQPPPPLPSAPTPQPPRAPAASIPDAPQPNSPQTPQPTAGSSVEQAARAALGPHVGGTHIGAGGGMKVGQQMAGDSAEILSDTHGIDFTEWIKRMKREVTGSWYPLIPEEVNPPLNKEGWTRIRIKMDPKGNVTEMHLEDSTHDRAIDKAAWGSITSLGALPPLPKEYPGQDFEIRLTFVISHNPSDLQ